ncbi:MAG TPA: 2TM domain-containing protein [Fimbriimonadaceae bacterium]|nr:2TM domain-containing protein [Fimbriimonadaceae bacterium]
MPGEKFYDEKEAEEILRLAAGDSQSITAMTRERLLATASELGITEDAVIRAEQKLAEKRADEERQKANAAEYAEFKASRWRQIFSGIGGWLSTSVMLLGINFLTAHAITWAIWPVGVWGFIELIYLLDAIFTPKNDREFERWKRRRRRRVERNAAEAELNGPRQPTD